MVYNFDILNTLILSIVVFPRLLLVFFCIWHSLRMAPRRRNKYEVLKLTICNPTVCICWWMWLTVKNYARNEEYGLDVRGCVHHSIIHVDKSNKMQQCIKILFFFIHLKLNMFRATHRPSSGAYNCTGSLWLFIRGRLLDVWLVDVVRHSTMPDKVHQPHV